LRREVSGEIESGSLTKIFPGENGGNWFWSVWGGASVK
jgi:hypothetical protein